MSQTTDGPIKDENKIVKDLDVILVKEVGQFGLYQTRTIIVAIIAAFFVGLHVEYIFSTARIDTRCYIPECDISLQETEFSPSWISLAIPLTTTNSSDSCLRFAPSLLNITDKTILFNKCSANMFDKNKIVSCDKYVYKNQHSVVYDFNLGCDEWRRTLIGFAKAIATFPALFITGIISDRWGRRTALTINVVNSGWLGLIKPWMNSYTTYTIVGALETIFGGGVFSAAYILAIEEIGPKYRVFCGALLSSFLSVGEVALGLIAWKVEDWKVLPLIVYGLNISFILLWFCYSESVRWHLSKRRYDDAEKVLKNMARINKKTLSENVLVEIRQLAEKEITQKLECNQKNHKPWLVVLVFQHKPVLIRCLISPIWWITFTFVYYGMSINSVNLSGNPYISFISVAAIDIPGFWIAYLLLDRVGRKPVLAGAYMVCSACHIAYLLLPHGLYGAPLALYLIGKCSIAVVVVAIYLYTSELYPTKYRHSLLAFSSMVGRTGFVICQLIPAFGDQIGHIIFATMSCLSGLLVFITPETLGAKFPDTMEDAADMVTEAQSKGSKRDL